MTTLITPHNRRMNNSWRWEAKCLGDDPAKYDLDNRTSNKEATARELCAGCPVKRECATDALMFEAWGTVRAGVWLPGNGLINYQQQHYMDVLQRVAAGEDA